MGEWTVRPTRPDETDDVHAMFDAYHLRHTGRPFPLTVSAVSHQFTRPGRIPELDITTVELDGRPVARSLVFAAVPYSEVTAYAAFDVGLSVDEVDEAVRRAVDGLEAATRARVPSDDPAAHAIGLELIQGDDASARALRRLGFEVARRNFEMEMDLDPAMPPPEAVVGVTIRPWHRDQETAVIAQILTAAFQDHHGDAGDGSDVPHFLARDNIRHDLTLVAEDQEGPMGVVVAMDRGDTGYVSSLGVLRRARGRGVGRALLLHVLAGFAADGRTRASLDVDASNLSGATRLYESVGMRPVVVYEVWTRPLDA